MTMPLRSPRRVALALLVALGCSSSGGPWRSGADSGGGGGDDGLDDDGLGDGPVTPARSWPGLAVGFDHWCLLDGAGALDCGGNGFLGQTDPPPGAYTAVDAGLHHACGLQDDGSAVCWGFGGFGATQVPEGPFVEVDAGGYHSCGLREDGAIACWGGIRDGEAVAPDGTYTQVSGGEGHTCALSTAGEAVCWGLDESGQASPPDVPLAIVRSGWTHSCGVEADGTPHCWGEDTNGESTPPDLRFVDIAAGRHVSCGIDGEGALHCWGRGAEGLEDPPEGRYDALSLGSTAACARSVDGEVACWGDLAEDTPRQARAGSGFHVTGIAWDMALRDWSAAGLCLSEMDPVSFWRNEEIQRGSTTRIQGAGAFELPDADPFVDFGLMYLMEDCEGAHDIVPTASGIVAEMYAGRGPGDTVGGAFAISFDRATLSGWTEDLRSVGYQGGDIADRGGIFIVIVDEDGRFVEDATITCDGGDCRETWYLDRDASDGLFATAGAANAATTGGVDSGVLVLGSPMRTYAVQHPTLEFDRFEMASRPGTMTVFMFIAR